MGLMFNKKIFFVILITIFILLYSVHISLGKVLCGKCNVCCGGSGKKEKATSCETESGVYANCKQYYDPSFFFFENNSFTKSYYDQNLSRMLLPFGFLISSSIIIIILLIFMEKTLFVLKVVGKLFDVKPIIIRTKCKYYSKYWIKKFKEIS
jgi:hypothetical protein